MPPFFLKGTFMIIDKATLIGSAHALHMSPSEDYAHFREQDQIVRLALADGCSDGQDSDLASREIVHLALDRVNETVNLPELAKIQLASNRVIHKHLATLLVADITPDRVNLHITGDGAYGIMYAEAEETYFEVNIIDYSHNQPEYPVYHAHPVLYSKWQSQSSTAIKSCKTYRWRLGETAVLCETTVLPTEGPLAITYDRNQIEGVFLMSDGITSFSEKSQEDVLTDMFQFKNLRGPFLVRRYRTAKLHQATHHDDFTVIAAHWRAISC